MSAVAHFRRTFATGLLVVLPVLVTIWVLATVFGALDRLGFAPLIEALVGRRLPGLGLALTLTLIYVIGLLAGNIVGARLVAAFEDLLLKVPIVRSVFGPAKQLFLALGGGTDHRTQEVVAVEYPRRGLFMIGFVTRRDPDSLCVFLPTAPNPTSGFLVLCDPSEAHPLPMSFDEAMQMIVSGGMVQPPRPLRPGSPPAPPPPQGERVS